MAGAVGGVREVPEDVAVDLLALMYSNERRAVGRLVESRIKFSDKVSVLLGIIVMAGIEAGTWYYGYTANSIRELSSAHFKLNKCGGELKVSIEDLTGYYTPVLLSKVRHDLVRKGYDWVSLAKNVRFYIQVAKSVLESIKGDVYIYSYSDYESRIASMRLYDFLELPCSKGFEFMAYSMEGSTKCARPPSRWMDQHLTLIFRSDLEAKISCLVRLIEINWRSSYHCSVDIPFTDSIVYRIALEYSRGLRQGD